MHPLALLGLLAVKKAAAASLYVAGKRYGWPRVYRRILEHNRRLMPAQSQALVRSAVADAFRMPAHAARILETSEVYQLAQRALEEQRARGALPALLLAAAQRRLERAEELLGELAAMAARHLPGGARAPPSAGGAGRGGGPRGGGGGEGAEGPRELR